MDRVREGTAGHRRPCSGRRKESSMTFDVILQQLAAGFGKTLLIFFLTLAFSLPLGLLVCLGRMSRWAPFRALGKPGAPPRCGGLCRSGPSV